MNQYKELIISLRHLESSAEREQQIYEGLMNWKIEKEEMLKSEFIDQAEWLPVITFILGTVSTGFLKAIGSEIWSNLKEIFVDSKGEVPGFEFKFNYEGVEVTAKIQSEDKEVIKRALENLNKLVAQIDFDNQQTASFIWTTKNNWQQEAL